MIPILVGILFLPIVFHGAYGLRHGLLYELSIWIYSSRGCRHVLEYIRFDPVYRNYPGYNYNGWQEFYLTIVGALAQERKML
jgi:succinate dehydrogenase/fumarate reductase cytochrome b subunit